MRYLYESVTLEGFIQQLACNYLPHGYHHFFLGKVPVGKDPKALDAKLLELYGIAVSPSQRARRKRAGFANLHYLRFDRDFLFLSTEGKHRFFEDHRELIRDARKVPIRVGGYSVRLARGGFLRRVNADEPAVPDGKSRVRVQIEKTRYTEMKAYLLEMATRWPVEELEIAFRGIPFEPYAPVRVQLVNLLRWVNRARKAQGLPEVPKSVIRYQRRIVKPFELLPPSASRAA